MSILTTTIDSKRHPITPIRRSHNFMISRLPTHNQKLGVPGMAAGLITLKNPIRKISISLLKRSRWPWWSRAFLKTDRWQRTQSSISMHTVVFINIRKKSHITSYERKTIWSIMSIYVYRCKCICIAITTTQQSVLTSEICEPFSHIRKTSTKQVRLNIDYKI